MSDKLVRIKNRYDSAENWMEENPVLAAGEIGIDSTNKIIKVGNGSSNWNKLEPYNSLKCFDKSDGSPWVTVFINTSYHQNESGNTIFLLCQHLLTINIVGYYPCYVYSTSTILEDPNDTISIKPIPATDANASLESLPELIIRRSFNMSNGVLKYELLGIDNKDSGILHLDDIGEEYATIHSDTVFMSLEKVLYH